MSWETAGRIAPHLTGNPRPSTYPAIEGAAAANLEAIEIPGFGQRSRAGIVRPLGWRSLRSRRSRRAFSRSFRHGCPPGELEPTSPIARLVVPRYRLRTSTLAKRARIASQGWRCPHGPLARRQVVGAEHQPVANEFARLPAPHRHRGELRRRCGPFLPAPFRRDQAPRRKRPRAADNSPANPRP